MDWDYNASSVWKRLAPLCIERAGTVPLAVTIVVPDTKGNLSSLKALLPHVARGAHIFWQGARQTIFPVNSLRPNTQPYLRGTQADSTTDPTIPIERSSCAPGFLERFEVQIIPLDLGTRLSRTVRYRIPRGIETSGTQP